MRFRSLIISASVVAVLLALLAAGKFATLPANRAIGVPPDDLKADAVFAMDSLGRSIKGWSIDGAPDGNAVLLLHGVKADRRSMVRRARFLSAEGYSILMIDLQAHGESPGDHITFGQLEAKSVSAAIRFARTKWPDKRLGVIGTSLGGASAIFAAREGRADAYILETVYSTLREATENRLRIRFGSLGPLIAPLLLWQTPLWLGFDADALSPAARIRDLKAPVLIIAGENDRRTTLANSKALFAGAIEPKALWVVSGARHQDFLRYAGDAYKMRVLAFLKQHLQ